MYKSLSDFCFGDGGLEIRIPWQLLNVMDPSSKMQIDDFRQTQVFTPKKYDEFSFGFGVSHNGEALEIAFGGSFGYDEWNVPTWHERLKPAYYELQTYLEKYRTED